MSLAIAALVALSFQAKKAASAPVPPYVGQWVTIQAAGVSGKQELKLAKDGTFTMTIFLPNSPNHVAKGHFTIKQELPPGTEDKRDVSLYLQLENVDGKAIDKDKMAPKKLGYYSRGPILTDTIAVVFCHPGDETKITKMFADQAKTKKGG